MNCFEASGLVDKVYLVLNFCFCPLCSNFVCLLLFPCAGAASCATGVVADLFPKNDLAKDKTLYAINPGTAKNNIHTLLEPKRSINTSQIHVM